MKNCNRIHRSLAAAAMALVAALTASVGCTTTADYTMGEELAPGNQQMVVRHRLYSGGMLKETDSEDTPCKVFEARLYQTDSVASAKLDNLYLGLHSDSRFGVRKLGFTSQYLFMEAVNDTTGFGFRPVYDSAMFRFAVDTFAGDTTRPVKYHVYELTADLVNEESEDSVFYLSYDPRAKGQIAADAQPIFTFEFPDPAKGVYTTSTSVRMRETPATREFINRLLCTDPDNLAWDGMAVKNVEAYSSDSAFIHNFRGLYIEAAADMPEGEGSVFSFNPSATGFEVLGRSRNNGADMQIMADTIDMVYYFKDSYAGKYGNMWVQSARHDYSGTEFATHPFDESQAVREEVALGYIDGCGGVITELTFTDDFLNSLRNINGGDEDYVSAAINQAAVRIYFEKSDYDYNKIDPVAMGETLNASMSRLGMYTNYKTLTPVADYLYTQESSSTSLAYNGYANRSLACYEMNISSYMQSLVNELLELEPEDDGTVDLDKLTTPRKIYLGPGAYDRFTFTRSVVQGGDTAVNPAAIQVALTYTLVK